MDARAIEKLIYQQSGLLGVSGISSDMRTLEASDEPAAREAIDLYVYRIGRELGSLAAALGGLDAIVFTAGIGENSRGLRERVCRDAAWLGVELDEAANESGAGKISSAGEPRRRVGHPDQRGTDDRAPYGGHPRPAPYGARSCRMTVEVPNPPLKGRKALVVGVANEHSIAYGCAKAFRELGAELAITYLNDKARPYVEKALARPVAEALPAARRQQAGRARGGVRRRRRRPGASSTSSCTRSPSRPRRTCRAG